ncbi:MAG TPA: hypothetical protein VLF39_02720 [Candidatus Saccharimonadales bacterium]|nr:hypothetical protein [Candidatus Saccharimonadales bacterium]
MAEQSSTPMPTETLDQLAHTIEENVLIQSLREIKASPEVVRAAAHVILDRALDRDESSNENHSDQATS